MEPVTHPMQPVVLDKDGVARFKANAIVRFLIDYSHSRGVGLNELALMPFDAADREQFAQLIGYSVSGFGELGYVSDGAYQKAAEAAQALTTEGK